MNTDKEIKKLERKIASLKANGLKHAARRKKTALSKIGAVLKQFGYDTIHELLEIADTAVVATTKTRKRTKVTDPIRKSVISDLKRGDTVSVVAKHHKISTATVNNIKKAAGLTKSSKPVVKKSAPKKKKSVVKFKPSKSPTKVTAPKTVKAKFPASTLTEGEPAPKAE
jgi:hypothetical protein